MNIVIWGATGSTGALIVEQALADFIVQELARRAFIRQAPVVSP